MAGFAKQVISCLGDDTKKDFINLCGNLDELDSDVKALYHYLKDHKVTDCFPRDLDDAVINASDHKEWEIEYMQNRAWEMDHSYELDCAKKEGREEGRTEIFTIIKSIITGKAKEDLINEGIAPELIENALEALGR